MLLHHHRGMHHDFSKDRHGSHVVAWAAMSLAIVLLMMLAV